MRWQYQWRNFRVPQDLDNLAVMHASRQYAYGMQTLSAVGVRLTDRATTTILSPFGINPVANTPAATYYDQLTHKFSTADAAATARSGGVPQGALARVVW